MLDEHIPEQRRQRAEVGRAKDEDGRRAAEAVAAFVGA